MRFYLGETYQYNFAGEQRSALVVGLADGGRMATLRFDDTGDACTVHSADISSGGTWRKVVQHDDGEPA